MRRGEGTTVETVRWAIECWMMILSSIDVVVGGGGGR